MEWHEAIAILRPHLVHIATPAGAGTGWLLSRGARTGTCAIATAAHVIQEAHEWEMPIRITSATSQEALMLRAPDRAILIDQKRDTAGIVFSARDFRLPDEPLKLITKDWSTKVGVEIGWLGFPAIPGAGLSFFSGRVSSYQHTGGIYFVDGVAINGVSGGPAFRIEQRGPLLIGVVSAYIPNRATGGQLPGVAVVMNVQHLHDVTASLRSLEEAKERQDAAPAPDAQSAPATEADTRRGISGGKAPSDPNDPSGGASSP